MWVWLEPGARRVRRLLGAGRMVVRGEMARERRIVGYIKGLRRGGQGVGVKD